MTGASRRNLLQDLRSAGLVDTFARVRRAYLKRIVVADSEGDVGGLSDLLALALYAELEIEQAPPNGRAAYSDVEDALGQALTAGVRLRQWSQSEAVEVVELAATLFSRSGYSAKAFTVLRPTARQVEALGAVTTAGELNAGKLRWWLRTITRFVISRDFMAAASWGAQGTQFAASGRIGRDQGRLALVVSALTEQVDRLARERPRPDDVSTLRGKTALARRLAERCGDSDLLSSVVRLEASLGAFLALGVMQTLARLGLRLPSQYELELTGRGSRRPIFELWQPQVQAIEEGLLRPGSRILSLPTSAGKTLLAELKIAESLGRDPDALVVYVAPYTALAVQVVDKLRERLQPAGLANPMVWTGTYEIDASVGSLGNLVVMTPEKLDAVIRGSIEEDPRSIELAGRLRLVVLDECHLIGAPGRGVTYELLITRLRARFPNVEVCAMSAVLGNPPAIAAWLTGSAENYSASQWRPTGTRFLVYSRNGAVVDHTQSEVARLGQWTVARRAAAVISVQFGGSEEWPVLVLETRRDWAEQLAEEANELVARGPWRAADRTMEARSRVANMVDVELGPDSSLSVMLRNGVAFHHAGVSAELRHEIEQLVRRRYLRIVVGTTTLAEGVDLPFRAVVCPHVHFERQAMSRAMFQNVVGRAGRAFAGTEGIVVFLEPAQAGTSRYLFDELLANPGEPIDVQSRLSAVGRDPRSVSDLRVVWRFESQLLGVLADGSFGNDQAGGLARGTYAGSRGSMRDVGVIRQRAETLLKQWETLESPLAVAASPYRLTDLGRAACLSGLSAASTIVLRREIVASHSRSEPWLREAEWAQPILSDQLLSGVIEIALTPLEALSQAIELGHDESTRLETIRAWSAGQRSVFEAATELDRMLLRRWLRGDDTKAIAAEYDEVRPERGPLRRRSRAGRILDLNDYFSGLASLLAWMFSAVIRLGTHLEAEDGLRWPAGLELGIKLLGFGVDGRVSAFLVERLGINRTAAVNLARTLIQSGVVSEELATEYLAQLSLSELATLTADEGVAERLWRRLGGSEDDPDFVEDEL